MRGTVQNLTFLAIIGSLSVYSADPQTHPPPKNAIRLERSVEAMGTTFVIEIYGTDDRLMQSAADEAFVEVRRLDRMLSNYIPSSELSRVNERAGKHPVMVSREFFDLLATCERYSRQSDGTFDITVGPLLKIWGFYKGLGRLPSNAEIRLALGNVGHQNLELDSTNLTVRFKKPGVDLDPGGVAKGYAVDRMAAVLMKSGIASALVSAGGSSIFGIGAPPNDPRGWYIRIRDPKRENSTAAEVYLKDNSISTSGSYEKFFWANGRLYSHIMNPRTGYPSEGMLAVSVVSPRTVDSEIWAKPYYILGSAWTEQHKAGDFRVLICEDKPGASCRWLP
ncbi:MAG: FAD:protein FMN transferase [Bryobacteraceae bacterium]|jgi:thiamine biosynthesis lipoprotein